MNMKRHLLLIVGFLMMRPHLRPPVRSTRPSPASRSSGHLSSDQTFREWSHDSNPTDKTKVIKVCRAETVCKMRYREGHTPRTRVREPRRATAIRGRDLSHFLMPSPKQVRQELHNLRDKRGVTVRFIGYTDDAPLTGGDESTYGNHLSLSKARALRVALAMQEILELPASAIESDGRGAPTRSRQMKRCRDGR